jgi:hypothetical protein
LSHADTEEQSEREGEAAEPFSIAMPKAGRRARRHLSTRYLPERRFMVSLSNREVARLCRLILRQAQDEEQ